ncbi:MAG: hypothetical protein ACLFU5_03360 [Thermoplasmata archaeon]
MNDEFIDVEKEVYEKGERVRIELRNDGSAKWSPLSQYLKIYHKDSSEKVYEGHRDIAMPAVPKTQTVFWDQTDIEGEKVEPGEYRAVFLEKYEDDFKIK